MNNARTLLINSQKNQEKTLPICSTLWTLVDELKKEEYGVSRYVKEMKEKLYIAKRRLISENNIEWEDIRMLKSVAQNARNELMDLFNDKHGEFDLENPDMYLNDYEGAAMKICMLPYLNAMSVQRMWYLRYAEQNRLELISLRDALTPPMNGEDDWMILFKQSKRVFNENDYCYNLLRDRCLHIAVSYRHLSKKVKMNRSKARDILKEAFRKAKGLGYNHGSIRLWIDQGLYRKQNFQEEKWYKFGLYPYTILPTIFMEDSRIIHSRPWLAVEKLCDIDNMSSSYSCAESEIFTVLTSNRNSYVTALSCVGTMKLDEEVYNGYEYTNEFNAFIDWARLKSVSLQIGRKVENLEDDDVIWRIYLESLSEVIFLRAESKLVDSLLKRRVASEEINIHDMFGHSGKLSSIPIDYVIPNIGAIPWREEDIEDKCYIVYDNYNIVQVKRDKQGFARVLKNKYTLTSQRAVIEYSHDESLRRNCLNRAMSWQILAESGNGGKAARRIKLRTGIKIWCMETSQELGSYGYIARTVIIGVLKGSLIYGERICDMAFNAEIYMGFINEGTKLEQELIDKWKSYAKVVRLGRVPTVNMFKQRISSVSVIQDPYAVEADVVLYSIRLKKGKLVQRISSMKRVIVVETQIEDIEEISRPTRAAQVLNERSALELIEFIDRKVRTAEERDKSLCWLIDYLGQRRTSKYSVRKVDNEAFNVTKAACVAITCFMCRTARIPLVYSEPVLVDKEEQIGYHTEGISASHKACEDGCELTLLYEIGTGSRKSV